MDVCKFLMVIITFGLSGLYPDSSAAANGGKIVNLESRLEYFQDSSGEIGFADILRGKAKFKKSPGVINFGFTKSVYWFRVKLNQKYKRPQDLIMQVKYASLDQLTLFIPKGKSSYYRQYSGREVRIERKKIQNRFIRIISDSTQ